MGVCEDSRSARLLRFDQECPQEHRRLYGPDYKGDLIFCEPDGSYLIPRLVSKIIVRDLRRQTLKMTDAWENSIRGPLQ
jgi:hypothetical protein